MPRVLSNRILQVCGAIATIAETAQGVTWVYKQAWPYVEPIFSSGLYCPEHFWWDSLAYPVQHGGSATKIHSDLKAVVAKMRTDSKDVERRLEYHSERDRERIADAYFKVLSEIRKHYPDLANAE